MMRYIVLSAGQEWNTFSWANALNCKNIIFFENILSNFWAKKFWYRKFFRSKFLLKNIWLRFLKRKLGIDKKDNTCLLIYDWAPITMSRDIIHLLRKEYPAMKIVYIFTNFTKVSGAKTYGLLDNLKRDFDLVFAFDPLDAEKYGFEYSRLIYEPMVDKSNSDTIEYDLFYVGQAKDRYSKLIEIFKDAVSHGLRCKFFITGVSEKDRYEHPEIVYNQPLPYSEVLNYINKSKCLVDAIQSESSGMTIKTAEAVVLGRKLITTNECVKDESYYRPSNILVYDGNNDLKKFIDAEFIPYAEIDQYEFSHVRLFRQIEGLLNK